MWRIIFSTFLLYAFVLAEFLIRIKCSRIQNTFFSKIFYWTMYAATRFVYLFIDGNIDSLDKPDKIMTIYKLIRNFVLFSFSTASATTLAMKMLDWVENRRLDPVGTINGLNRLRRGQVRFGWRHYHVPIYDLITLIFTILRRGFTCVEGGFVDGIWPCKSKIFPVTMIDSYPNDPIFPECSVMHSIMLFVCDECTKDNGFYLIRSSQIRQQSLVRYLGPVSCCRRDVDRTWMSVIYQGGLILINMANQESQKFYSYDIRNDRFSTVFIFKPPSNGQFCWILLDDGKELGDQRNSSSTYFRIFIKAGQGVGHPFGYMQCLMEISEDKLHFDREVIYPWPWLFQSHQPFITSTGQVGMRAKVRDATSDGEVIWKTCVVNDPKSFELKAMPNMEDLMETDRPLHLYTQRYLENNDTDDVPCASVLNEREALVCRNDGTIWRTRFQPPSLKSICLEKIYKAYGKQLSNINAKDWLRMTGVDMGPHFPSQNWRVLK